VVGGKQSSGKHQLVLWQHGLLLASCVALWMACFLDKANESLVSCWLMVGVLAGKIRLKPDG
jgi:hypothetical protein